MTASAFRFPLLGLALSFALSASALHADTPAPKYERIAPSRDGIGVRYMGREIAQVMGWQGAAWLERSERLQEERTDLLIKDLPLSPGMTVADIGAGEGYYTIKLAKRVGAQGRVLAEDIQPEVRDALAERVTRERLQSVSVRLGEPADPKLPDNSFDRVLMVHMYHEIEQPYEFLWRLRPSLKPDGLVIVVDADRKTQNHGTPPSLLECEFAAIGYRLVSTDQMPSAGGYLAAFRAVGTRPAPAAIKPCRIR